jgi:hypothetical protein
MSDMAIGGLGRSNDGFSSVWWREEQSSSKGAEAAKEHRRRCMSDMRLRQARTVSMVGLWQRCGRARWRKLARWAGPSKPSVASGQFQMELAEQMPWVGPFTPFSNIFQITSIK